MKRRRFLGATTAGLLAGLAGCLGSAGDGGPTSTDATRTTTTADAGTTTATTTGATPDYGEVELPIPRDDLNRGAAKNAIPALVDPAFGTDWGPTEYSLRDSDQVIGVKRGGEARAYPLRILDWHEIVNDDFDGPLLVSYCPLCGSGLTAVREVDGEATNFGVSGFLYQSDLVMFDELTNTLWSQIMATGINGPRTGETLELVPSTLTTWEAWKSDNPDTAVLLPPPASGTIVDARPRPYDRYPYGNYGENERIGIGFNDFEDDRLHPKAQVIGVSTEDAAKAYPFETVEEEGVVNDTVGDLPVVVAAGPGSTLVAYERTVDGETLTFEAVGGDRMRAGGSNWAITTGEAVDGPHEGTRLEQASNATTMFWFAWVDFNPGSEIYGQDG